MSTPFSFQHLLGASLGVALLLCEGAQAAAPRQVSAQAGAGPQAEATRGRKEKRIVGYFVEWGIYARNYHPQDIPADKVSHVNYAFANIGTDLQIQIGDWYAAVDKYYPGDTWSQPYRGCYNQLNNVVRAQHPHLKTFISVGGWTWSGRFSDAALTAQSRLVFAQSCVDFIRSYNFDGVDIDWEYPVSGGLSSNVYRPDDEHNYTLLMLELRQQLDAAGAADGREYLLTIAGAAGYDKMVNYEMAALGELLDWINVMTYDFRGAWDLSLTAHHSGLEANPAGSAAPLIAERYNGRWAMDAWRDAGVPADKLVMGVPFYGRAWGGVPAAGDGLYQPAGHVPGGTWDDSSSGATGVNDFWEVALMEQSSAYTRHWDALAKVPWLFAPGVEGGHFVSYDDPQSVGEKVRFIQSRGYGGAMFWEFSGDRNELLMDVLDSSLR